jgi:nucleotide-binding universal stress UspA family protein
MYERLIAQVSDPIVRRVMRRLKEASQKRHLPAFKRCLSRTGRGCSLRAAGPRTSANVIVLGAYTRCKFRRLVFGGLARAMLAESPLPLLMMY